MKQSYTLYKCNVSVSYQYMKSQLSIVYYSFVCWVFVVNSLFVFRFAYESNLWGSDRDVVVGIDTPCTLASIPIAKKSDIFDCHHTCTRG